MTAAGILARRRYRQATATTRRTWVSGFVVLSLLYLLTAHWYGVQNIDSLAAAWPGWQLAHHGNVWLEGNAGLPDLPWFSEVQGHVVSNRTPGIIVVSVPVQLLLRPVGAGPLVAATVTAALLAAAAVANLTLLARRLGVSADAAVGAGLLLGLGTGFWANGSSELWPHAPDVFWMSLAMLALQRDRAWLAGLAFAPAVLTRPHLALVVLATATVMAWVARSTAPLLALGVPTGAALVALSGWNAVVFGNAGLEGGYRAHLEHAEAYSWGDAGVHLLGSLVSPLRGVLVLSPFVVVLAVAAWRARRVAPAWMLGLGLGALLYQAAQLRLTGFEGGAGFFSYRYPLEALALLFPLAVLGFRFQPRSFAAPLRWLAGFSVAGHVLGAFWFRAQLGAHVDPWRTWGVGSAASSHGAAGAVLAGLVAGALLWAIAVRRPVEVPADAVLRDELPGLLVR